MPTYTTADLYAEYTGTEVPTGAELDALNLNLEAAERDIDAIIGPIPRYGALKLNPAVLVPWEATALSRAVCAQWKFVSDAGGYAALAARVEDRVIGPDFTVFYAASAGPGGRPIRYGPEVKRELEPIAHLRHLGGRVR